MARFGFCGGTYQSASINVDAERAINFYPEVVEASGASQYILLHTPGQRLFANLGSSAVLGIFSCRPNGATTDRLFAVVQDGINQTLWELLQNGTSVNRGTLNAPTTPIVTMKHNGLQLAICTGGKIWVLTLSTNSLALAGTQPGGAIEMIEYCDGFGLALQQNSNQFWVSNLLDFTVWPGTSTAQVSEFPDNVVSMIVNQRQVAFLGTKASVLYQDTGAIEVPFQAIQGVFVENGCCAPFATARLDNSVFWLDMDERGSAVARRANGYTPQRISNHAVESFWNSYPTVTDAISYSYQEEGHSFWVLYFPSGTGADGIPYQGATWVYDVASGMWHERAFWNEKLGYYQAHHSQNHALAWGMHFVGDWATGNVYQQSTQFYDDAGANIRRIRRAPHISAENEYLKYHALTIDVEAGLGPVPPLTGSSDSPSSYVIGDASGNAYTLSMSDVPQLQIVAGNGTPQAMYFTDVATGQFWQLIINVVAGMPYLNLVEIASLAFPSYTKLDFATSSGKQAFIYVQGGQIEINGADFPARGPSMSMRYSKDHAHTWSNYQTVDCGQSGEYAKRVVYRRMGRARTMTFEISVSDAVPWRIVDAYLKASGADEFKPTQRLSKQLAKGA